jgi:hypothetical protein
MMWWSYYEGDKVGLPTSRPAGKPAMAREIPVGG